MIEQMIFPTKTLLLAGKVTHVRKDDLHRLDSGLSADQCALLEEHGLRFDWHNLSDSVYSDLYEKVGDLIIRKGINERGDGENELGERFHDILDALYDAYPDELLEDVFDS